MYPSFTLLFVMENIFQEVTSKYLEQKNNLFKQNPLAIKLRKDFPAIVHDRIKDKKRYKVIGSAGKSKWAECPWIAILDKLITISPQSGYYPVFLFKSDMTGVYLSLNQGVTDVIESYKSKANEVLRARADDFRAKIDLMKEDLTQIDLRGNVNNARLYEAGNIIARYYSSDSDFKTIEEDLRYYLKLYQELAFNDRQFVEDLQFTATERKKIRLHLRIERNSDISEKVKRVKGYICEACDFNFEKTYGQLGKLFIEAHHLQPISELEMGNTKLNIKTDFVVLCSNCHSMIHRLENSSNLQALRNLIAINKQA